ncbi:unnamed protein product [Ilex paraguariensis]|uniref:Secreted protein n=1 Tax=Ilex paraguariensis TaxID=185542 RepID=A0ABC8R3F7_9AQUA
MNLKDMLIVVCCVLLTLPIELCQPFLVIKMTAVLLILHQSCLQSLAKAELTSTKLDFSPSTKRVWAQFLGRTNSCAVWVSLECVFASQSLALSMFVCLQLQTTKK